MKIQQTTSYNQNRPNFCAISVPNSVSDKIRYGFMLETINRFAQNQGIKIKSGLDKSGEKFEYIMTKSRSESENKIFNALFAISDKVRKFKAHDIRSNIARHEKRYAIPKGNEEIFGVDGATSAKERIKLKQNTYKISLKKNNKDYANSLNLRSETKIVNRFSKFDFENCNNNNLKKLHEIMGESFDVINDNAYRGPYIVQYTEKSDKIIDNLEELGVKHAINLSLYNSPVYAKLCKESGINYIHFDVESFLKSNIATAKNAKLNENEKLLLSQFKNYINAKKAGNTYEGCATADLRTDEAQLLSKFFNPEDKPFFNIELENNIINKSAKLRTKMQNLYSNLSIEDKKELGWSKEFEARFKKKLSIQ